MKIYVVGNPLVDEDSLPLKILPHLEKLFPKIKFMTVDPNENFPPPNERELFIFDTVGGIKKPQIFTLSDIAHNYKLISPHDYDLGVHLLLLKKLKKIDSANIIGIPAKMSIANHRLLDEIISTLP